MGRWITWVFLILPLAAQKTAPFEVEEATIAQVHDAMKAGRLTCRALVALYLKRIDAYDKNGPAINSIVMVNPEVEKQAEELDRRFAQSGLTGPLHCVPVIVKDNFETKGLQTTQRRAGVCGLSPRQRRIPGEAREGRGRAGAGEIEHGGVGVQPLRDGQLDSAGIHAESLRAGSRDGGIERRHGGGGRGELRAGRARQRYRQFDPRTVVAPGAGGNPVDDGAHQPRRRASR